MDYLCKVATLANGTEVRIRPVSPHVRRGLHLRLEEALPPKPEMPTKELHSVDGHSEPVAAQEGDPEYEQWKKDFAAWRIKADRIEDEIGQSNMLRFVVYAIVGWRRHTNLPVRLLRAVININWLWAIFGLGWKNESPKQWQPDPIIRIPEEIDQRGVYIITEVISHNADYGIIAATATSELQKPITREEVGRQLDGFPPDG